MLDSMLLADDRAQLAAELATKLLPVPEVMSRHGLDAEQLKTLLTDSQFRRMVADFRKEWDSPLSARERVKLKSALAVEDGLVKLYQIFKDDELAPAARIEAFKQLVGLAEMGPKKDGVDVTPAFNLTLNLGGNNEPEKTINILTENTPVVSDQ